MNNETGLIFVRSLNIAILVFREGLESVLVLTAVMASMTEANSKLRRPVLAGAGAAVIATVLLWNVAVSMIDDLTEYVPALQVQAATGLVAIGVLLVIMNWFFHRVYWAGWISIHTNRKRKLMRRAADPGVAQSRVFAGLIALGFTSVLREGVEVILFLQSYRMKLGTAPVMNGVLMGCVATGVVAALAFVVHARLPYRKMLVLTGTMLGGVLLVMVGEQAQEMQLAAWLPRTTIQWLAPRLPDWAGLWFAIFPTIETLGAQGLAAALVAGSYFLARQRVRRGEAMSSA